jgi:hypothetical protein
MGSAASISSEPPPFETVAEARTAGKVRRHICITTSLVTSPLYSESFSFLTL